MRLSKLAVLEAVLASCIMISGVVYVVSQDPMPTVHGSSDHLLEVRMQDFLGTASALPVVPGACMGKSTMDRLVVEALAGKDDVWRLRRSKYFGPGIENSLYIWNGRAEYPLYESIPFKGVTASLPLVPEFSWVRPTGSTDVTGTDSFALQVAGLHRDELLRTKGDALRITVRSTSAVSADATVAWVPMALLDEWGQANAQNISWQMEGPPSLTTTARSDLREEDGAIFALNVSPADEEGSLEGVTAVVRVPSDWNILQAGNGAWAGSWNNSAGVIVLTFRANASASSSTAISFEARPPSNATRPFDVFTAQLGNGSLGQSSLIVRFPGVTNQEFPREVYPTVPYPVQAGSTAFFGAAFANGGEALVVRQVDIEIPGGYDFVRNGGRGVELFADAPLTPIAPLSEWMRLDARHVRWRGTVHLDPNEAAWWGVGIRITDDPSQTTSVENLYGNATRSTLRFPNGFEDASTVWSSSPGILRHRVPAGDGGGIGYDGGPADVGRSFTFEAQVAGHRATVTQPSSYAVAPQARFLQIQNGVTNASLQVTDRRAPLGSVVHAEADVQSLMTSLAAGGVTDLALNVSVYAPPSMGCHPTANWRLPAAGLPKAGAVALELWDAVPGAGSLYLAAADERAYRVEATGNPLWSHDLGAAPTRVATGPLGTLFVSDERGVVRNLDAATGVARWTVDLGALGVTSLRHDEATRTVVVGTLDGGLALLDEADGAVRASSSGVPGLAREDARRAPDGFVYSINGSTHVERHSALLEREAQSLPPSPRQAQYLALAWSPSHVLVAGVEGWVALDAATLAVLQAGDVAASVLHASAGDVNGDGAEDLALSLEDLSLVLVDGASRTAATFRPAAIVGGSKFQAVQTLAALQAASCRTVDDPQLPRVEGVALLAPRSPATYADSPLCSFHERNKPLALRIQDGRVAYAYAQAGQPRLCLLDDDLAVVWCRGLDPTRVPERLAIGAWGAGRAVAVASADGLVEVRDDATGDVLATTSPSQSIGRVAVRAGVPLGGFFGSHLLVAQVEWRDVDGTPRSIALADWFEVVDVDGTPMTNPHYRIVMVGRDRSLG